MQVVYRILKTKYADIAFDGYGAKTYGGRWNSKGVSMIYTSDSVALAVLEVLVHLHHPAVLPAYTLCSLEIPDNQVMTLAADALPEDWASDPAPLSTAAIGNEWITSKTSLALALPSTIVPMQKNILLNPEHPAFSGALKTLQCEPFSIDTRLVGD